MGSMDIANIRIGAARAMVAVVIAMLATPAQAQHDHAAHQTTEVVSTAVANPPISEASAAPVDATHPAATKAMPSMHDKGKMQNGQRMHDMAAMHRQHHDWQRWRLRNDVMIRHQNVEIESNVVPSVEERWSLLAVWSPYLQFNVADMPELHFEGGVRLLADFGGEFDVQARIAAIYEGFDPRRDAQPCPHHRDEEDRAGDVTSPTASASTDTTGGPPPMHMPRQKRHAHAHVCPMHRDGHVYVAVGRLYERPLIAPLYDAKDPDAMLDMLDAAVRLTRWARVDAQMIRHAVASESSLEAFTVALRGSTNFSDLLGGSLLAQVDHQSGFDTGGLPFARPNIPAGQVGYAGLDFWSGPTWLRPAAMLIAGQGRLGGLDANGRLLRVQIGHSMQVDEVSWSLQAGGDWVRDTMLPIHGEPHLSERLVDLPASPNFAAQFGPHPDWKFVRVDGGLGWDVARGVTLAARIRQTHEWRTGLSTNLSRLVIEGRF